MKDERNPLKVLAKEAVWYQDTLDKELLSDEERDGLNGEYEALKMRVIKGGYSSDLFVQYMEEYKELTIPQFYEWIKN
ncbi:hypothetical protein [Bacillus thuringiensis]|uniref:hypothetical protein n=1 Tax=Bacillus thuringiensis TaxID=1428 RepID=UPI000BFDA5DD|nr:hypothetical protein [Bacillus thuringiensis]PGM50836.1 hypothetical protein CN949_16225 [Bacillus thuringiensis]